MLRLPPSQIRLSPLDVKCHVERIPFHRSTCTLPQSTRELVARGKAYVDKQIPGRDHSMAHRYSCPSSNPTNIATDSLLDDSILVEDAVPQRDRMFWKRVVTHAGSSSDHHNSLDPQLSQFEDSSSNPQYPDDSEDVSRPEPSASDEESNEYSTGDEEHQCIQVQHSEDWVQHHVSERQSFVEGQDLSEDRENHPGATVYRTFLESAQADLTSVEEDDSDAESKSSNQIDLDGSAEGRVSHRSHQASLTSNLSALQIGEHVRSSYLLGARVLSETVYGSSDGDETPSSSSSERSSEDKPRAAVPQLAMFSRPPGCRDGLTLAAMGGCFTTRGGRLNTSSPSSPLEYEPGPGTTASSTEVYRRRSSNLPRSRLHLSHAAASSSPDKRGGADSSSDVGVAQETSLMGKSSGDCTTHNQKSESNSYVEAEIGGAVAYTCSEDDEVSMSDGELTELTSSPPEAVYDGNVDARYFSREQHSLWAQSPPSPHSAVNRSQDPQSLGAFTSSGLPPDALPPPFSASARTVSFNLSLPSSSPASQYFSSLSTPLRSSQNLYEEAVSASSFNIISRPSLPSLPYSGSRTAAFHARLAELNDSSEASQSSTPVHQTRLPTPIMPDQQTPPSSSAISLSPPPPGTPRSAIRVYDDRLPAYTQPQTPRYFRRDRQFSPNAAFTAPAAHGRNRYVTPTNRLRRAGIRTPSARIERRLFAPSDSPVMGSDYLNDDEQENTSVEEEVARRLETLRMWRQVAEQEREAMREGRLESTPPREERLGWD